MIWEDFLAPVITRLACGFADSSFIMGYGVTFGTLLLSFGIAPAKPVIQQW